MWYNNHHVISELYFTTTNSSIINNTNQIIIYNRTLVVQKPKQVCQYAQLGWLKCTLKYVLVYVVKVYNILWF